MRTKFHFEEVNIRYHLRDIDIDGGTIRMSLHTQFTSDLPFKGRINRGDAVSNDSW
jgi:hypothetical protein